jgi:hypothetical protein
MAEPIVVTKGAEISAVEVERITTALAALAKDPHAPKTITVTATLHVHNEYPKTLYKIEGGKHITRSGKNEEEEKAAIAEGFGPFKPLPVEPAA